MAYGPSSEIPNQSESFIRRIGTPRVDHDVIARAGAGQRQGLADAPTGPRDEGPARLAQSTLPNSILLSTASAMTNSRMTPMASKVSISALANGG